MDFILPMGNPMEFFVFIICSGILFQAIVKLFKPEHIFNWNLYKKLDKLSIFDNKAIDNLIIVSLIGMTLSMTVTVLNILLLFICILLNFVLSKIAPTTTPLMPFYTVYFGTVVWNQFIGTFTIVISILIPVLDLIPKIDNWREQIVKNRVFSLDFSIKSKIYNLLSFVFLYLFMMILLFGVIFLAFYSPIYNYNSQISYPINFGIESYPLNSSKEMMGVNISLSNPLDHDVIITSITYVSKPNTAGENIRFNTSAPNKTLMKKGSLTLSLKLNKTKVSRSYGCIHLRTSEGTIPIEFPGGMLYDN